MIRSCSGTGRLLLVAGVLAGKAIPCKKCPGAVSKTGWCWYNPAPQGFPTPGSGCSGGVLYLATDGQVVRYDGNSWRAIHDHALQRDQLEDTELGDYR